MRKRKLFILFISLCFILPVAVSQFLNLELFAAGTIMNSSNNEAVNSLHTGDEVHLGTASDDVYNVLGQKDGYVYLLKKNAINNTAVNFTTAETQSTAFLSDANFGKVGKGHLSLTGNRVGLISRSELNGLSVVSNEQIVSSIPTIANKWWLADKNTTTNRAGFASGSNALNVDGGIKKTTVSGNIYNTVTGGTCSNVSTGEKGVMPINNFNAASVVKSKYVSRGTIHFDYSEFKNKKATAYANATPGSCSAGSQGLTTVTKVAINMQYEKETSGRDIWTAASGAGLIASLISSFGWRPTILVDANGNFSINQPSKTVTTTAGQCLYSFYSGNGIHVDPKTNSSKYVSYKYAGNVTFTAYASVVGTPAVQTNYCPTLTNQAGTALIRPSIKIKASDIIMRNNAKRAYAPTATLDENSIPKSDNAGSFLTIQTSKLSVNLNSGVEGVSGNVLEIEKPKTGTTVSLPLYFGSENLLEGARYVSAEALDRNDQTVYGVLGSVGTGNTANVNIDYANLLKQDTNSFKVTLYLEDGGAKNTAYRSTGTEITVKLKEPQSIRFEANSTGTLTYGKKITVNAELYDFERDSEGNIKQSESDLTFSVSASDHTKAYIENQTYDKTQGKAQATIVPLTGTGTFTLEITKNGDDIYFNAQKQTITIQLEKKPLILVPSDPPGITAAIGDQMPSLEPEAQIINQGDGLVSGDVIPTELYPRLERVDVALAEHPAVNGIVTNPGSWKLLFPDVTTIVNTNVSQFLDKYELTLEDYDDDDAHVFTVDLDGILERWIEIYSPLPQVNGWYKTAVTLRPSQEAKYFGYFDIAFVEDGVDGEFGSMVELIEDTNGIRPIVKLKKTDGEISHAKQLNTRIKIDQTKPTVNIQIPNGWSSIKKTIDIQASDLTSGIDNSDSESVKVSYFDASNVEHPISLNNRGNGNYQFDATENGLYKFIIKDRAGNKLETFKTIRQIDTTPASLTATLGSLSSDGDVHDIQVTRVEPDSGINYIQVWFQGDGDETETMLGYLNRSQPTQSYQAQMNGRYTFKMKIGTGEILTADVIIADITQIRPVVGMNAINMGDNTAYIDSTWINQDVKITLNNQNVNFQEPITYQYRKTSDENWNDMEDNTLEVTTDEWIKELYEFRAVSTDVESRPVSINVYIDKERPQPPILAINEDHLYIDEAEIAGQVRPKPSGIEQTWEYSLDDGATWMIPVDEKININGAGEYEIQVRTKDEAGNISEIETYEIEIQGRKTQTIAFDEVPTLVTYGTDVRISAKLTSEVDEQANTELKFTIPQTSSNKIRIQSQGYDKESGEAWAMLHPLNGDVFFDIEISKEGDERVYAAVNKLKTIPLHKAPLTIYPQIIYGKVVGDVMPTLTSLGNGLVNSDTIPSQLNIVLTPDTGTTDPLPTDTGNPIITHAGTWKMNYPENVLTSSEPDMVEFMKKYDVTLEDHDTDTKYVFTTTSTGIPDAWVVVSPDPNTEGWNNSDVTLSLSDEAIANGYTSMALVEQGTETKYGATILLDEETSGMTPVVVLKSATETSGYKSLRYVKIDKTKPNANIEIEHENDWMKTDKKVTIQIQDARSGIKELHVKDGDGNEITLTQESTNTYSFISDNGTYHLTVSDQADNELETDITVAKIDKTAPTITAVLGALSTDESTQTIDVTATVGDSGVQSYAMYYKENASDPYPSTPSETFNPSDLTFTYQAHRNGFYRFEIVNGAGEKASAEVEVKDVVASYPIVSIKAELNDGRLTPYTSGKWVNEDVIITLSNTNTNITETITYEYRKAGDTTWTTLDDDTLKIEEDAWQNETYEFRGVISTGEGTPSTINVRIDKEKPEVPTIDNMDDFNEDNAFASPLTITGSTTPKDSGIGQTIMVSKDHGITWEEMSGNTLTLTTPDAYTLMFKTIDEAGNESEEITIEEVIVNDGTPKITIKLNDDPLRSFIRTITFGYFYKDSVEVDIEVEWYGMAEGDIYYILDDSETPTVPDDDDPRWITGDHTNIDPDRKTMIYAKAVNGEGKSAKTSSTYYVYADETPPTITFDKSYENWINDNTLTATIQDELSKVNNETIETRIDHSEKGEVEVRGSSLHFTSLPDGSYKLQVSASDNSGNETEETITVKIDTTPPIIEGVKDESIYHQYYLPRYITIEDKHSGVATAQITKDGNETEDITDEIKVKEVGTYEIQTKDNAGNERKLSFQIVSLPDIKTEIDCGEASKKVIEQIEQEYVETKEQLDETERNNIEKWLEDAHDIRNTCRIKIVYNEDKSAWVEGIGSTDFASDVIMVVEEISQSTLPKLPQQAKASYDVYLKQGNKVIEPNGKVRVHLPYENETQNITLYEINDKNQVKELSHKQEGKYLIFDTSSLEKYAIAYNEQNNTCAIEINQDSDGDGKPDLNIDIDHDGKADLNIDVDCDGIPDIDIDTDGDGKPDYNVDTDGDGEPNINMGSLPKPWKPNKCQTVNDVHYCTMGNLTPHLNIDTDNDGRPDVNLDIDNDRMPELNIDADGDLIPDVDIDTSGDGKPDINIDLDGDGVADLNLLRITKWKPESNYQINGFAYDTMSGLKPQYNIDTDGDGKADENLVDNSGNRYNLSSSNENPTLMNRVNTGDYTSLIAWILLFLTALIIDIYCIIKSRSRNKQSTI